MFILHNAEDAASRAFVAEYGNTAGVTVLDWYNETERQQWLDAGGTLAISAFPSVLLRHDTYTVEVDDGEGGTVEQTVEAGWDVLRMPESIDPLPDSGWVDAGLYTHDGAFLICRQPHERTIYAPHETPALFSVWRPDEPDMIWIAGEQVQAGWTRIYGGVRYTVITPHTTQDDWRPDLTPALWQAEEQEPEQPAAWVQPTHAGNAYNTGDRVTYQGSVYESTIDANVWSPTTHGWVLVQS